jgi:hypothetical protein
MSASVGPSAFERLKRTETRAAVAGVIGLVALLAGAFGSPDQFFRSYLPAFLFVFGIALGSLAALMLQHMTGGAWGLMIRRILEAGARTLPLVGVLFLPLAFGLPRLYSWADPAKVASDAILQAKAPYLNVWFFVIRAVIYFVIWSVFAALLSRWSAQQDATPGAGDDRRFRMLSGPGLVMYGLTLTFASVDWVMSLDPHWFSTIFGMLFIGAQGLSVFAFAIAVLALVSDLPPFAGRVKPAHFLDLGKLMFAFVILWAYLAFSQFLIIWSGNLPEEITWYLERASGGWQWVALVIALGHFALPFLVLLSRDLKKNRRALMTVAIGILVMRYVDSYWLTAPSFSPEHLSLHWMDVAAVVGLTGIWLAAFFRLFQSRQPLPVNDPYFEDALAHGGH